MRHEWTGDLSASDPLDLLRRHSISVSRMPENGVLEATAAG